MIAPREDKRISYPSRKSIRIGGHVLTPLQALALVNLRELHVAARCEPRVDGDYAAACYRHWLASNLTYDEWRKRGFNKGKAGATWAKALRVLRDAGLAEPFTVNPTDQGNALALSLRPLFQPPLRGDAFRAYCESTYSRVSGRIE